MYQKIFKLHSGYPNRLIIVRKMLGPWEMVKTMKTIIIQERGR